MSDLDFWQSINEIISNDFNPDGLEILEGYADKIKNNEILFKRFSPQEQYGCTEGGTSHVIASILAGAENTTNQIAEGISDFKRMVKQGEDQALIIENWARKEGIWLDDIDNALSNYLGEEIAEGGDS